MTRGATNTAVQGIGRHDRARTQQAGLNDTTLTKTPVQAPIQHRISERYMPLNHARPGQRLGIRPSSMAKDKGGDAHGQPGAGEAGEPAAVDRVDPQGLEPLDAPQGVDPADVDPLAAPLGLADEGGGVRAELPLGAAADYLELRQECPRRTRRVRGGRPGPWWTQLTSAVHHVSPGGAMRVQRVLMPDSALESWTVLGDDHAPVEPVERYLAYLASIERSPNTVKAYAHDLKDWFCYLARCGLDWRAVTLEDVASFVAWLRLPPQAREGQVAVLAPVYHHCAESSVNRKLSAVSAFCGFHARRGVDLGALLVTMRPAGRRGGGSWKPLLHHVAKGRLQPRRTIKLNQPKPLPKVLTARQVQAILDACEHLRDRLLFAVLFDAGVRIGEALGLRHEDLAVAAP